MNKIREFTEQEAERYVKNHGLFPADAKLSIRTLASGSDDTEGLVNLIYQIKDTHTGKSLIFKQVMPYVLALMKHEGVMRPTARGRTAKEVRAMVLMNVIYPGITPEVYFQDTEQGIICMEDLSHLRNMRFQLTDRQQFPDFGIQIGAFLAEMLFFTSDLYLDAQTKRQWEQLFDAQEAKELLLDLLFQESCALFDSHRPFEAGARETHQRIASNRKLKAMVHDMGTRFYEGKQCICHTDLHTGNIMIAPGETRLIDCEYGGYSAFFGDLGRIAGSFIVNYVSWLGTPEIPYESRLCMQQYDLDIIRGLFHGCLETLRQLFTKYRPKRPALRRIDPETYFMSFFYDSIRCAAVTAACRTPSDWTQPCDLARIKNTELMGLVQKRALEIAEYTLEHGENFRSIENFCGFIQCCAGVNVQKEISRQRSTSGKCPFL